MVATISKQIVPTPPGTMAAEPADHQPNRANPGVRVAQKV
jgi:hypothetical protein